MEEREGEGERERERERMKPAAASSVKHDFDKRERLNQCPQEG